MSWTDVFPVLTDELVEHFQSQATPEEVASMRSFFKVVSIHNRRTDFSHLVSTSLFWKRDSAIQGELPVVTRDLLVNAESLGLAGRYDPWKNYVVPLVNGARALKRERPDIVVRVYLANDLGFLIEDLIGVGCEVHLMESSSICHNPGAMWRFLALEQADYPVTVTDSDRIKWILADVARTEAAGKVGVGGWRVPYHFSCYAGEGYRPMSAAQFGSHRSYPMELLMTAFVWHSLRDSLPAQCVLEGLRDQEIAASQWPDYGFDEWFLLAGLFPRMAFEGLLTFVPWDIPPLGQFFTLDVEYCTWANPNSELINYPNPETALGDVIRPWSDWKDPIRLRVRPDTLPVCRSRKNIGPVHRIKNGARDGVEDIPRFSGELPVFLASAAIHVKEAWFVDLSPQLDLSQDGAELFLDRRYEGVDLAFCGHYFTRVSGELATWAARESLDAEVWRKDAILKIPKLEGPMTLWSTDFARGFQEDLAAQPEFMKAEILLRARIDQGRAIAVKSSAKSMGWKVR